MTTPFDDYLDLVESARELSIHPQSLRRLIKQKKAEKSDVWLPKTPLAPAAGEDARAS